MVWAVLLAALLVKAVELGCRKCKTAPAAVIAGGTTAAVTVVWQMMKIPDASTVAIGILEGVFVFCFVFFGDTAVLSVPGLGTAGETAHAGLCTGGRKS